MLNAGFTILFANVIGYHILICLSTNNFTRFLTGSFIISFLTFMPLTVYFCDGAETPVNNEYSGT